MFFFFVNTCIHFYLKDNSFNNSSSTVPHLILYRDGKRGVAHLTPCLTKILKFLVMVIRLTPLSKPNDALESSKWLGQNKEEVPVNETRENLDRCTCPVNIDVKNQANNSD